LFVVVAVNAVAVLISLAVVAEIVNAASKERLTPRLAGMIPPLFVSEVPITDYVRFSHFDSGRQLSNRTARITLDQSSLPYVQRSTATHMLVSCITLDVDKNFEESWITGSGSETLCYQSPLTGTDAPECSL
jgi:hypothetical protein